MYLHFEPKLIKTSHQKEMEFVAYLQAEINDIGNQLRNDDDNPHLSNVSKTFLSGKYRALNETLIEYNHIMK